MVRGFDPGTVPGIGWVLAYTIATELADISRFSSRANSPATA
jgi:transposase